MKKERGIALVFLLIILIIVITIVKANNNKNSLSMSELTSYYYSHTDKEYEEKLRGLKEEIDSLSFEELVTHYEEIVMQWKEEQRKYPIEYVDVNGANRSNKLYNNIILTVDIYYVPDDENMISKNRIYDEIIERLRNTPYGYYKINTIQINLYRSEIDTEEPYATRESITYWQNDIEKRVFVVE